MKDNRLEIAAIAARWVVEEGLEYRPAKQRAVRELVLSTNIQMPGNDLLEEAVREYLAVYCADTQPGELLTLRRHAALWMKRLAEFRPHLTGAVWRGTATQLSDIYLQLFCDDPKSAEIEIINQGHSYQTNQVKGFRGELVDSLIIFEKLPDFKHRVAIHLMIHDHDDLRGALMPDRQGLSQRGDLNALNQLLNASKSD